MGNVNCNICVHVSQTEEEQKNDCRYAPHICMIYQKRVIHQSQELGDHSMIYPCEECVKSMYENFMVRGFNGR